MRTRSFCRRTIPEKQFKDFPYKRKTKPEQNLSYLNWRCNKNEVDKASTVDNLFKHENCAPEIINVDKIDFEKMMNSVFSIVNEEVQYLQDYLNIFRKVPNTYLYYSNQISTAVENLKAIKEKIFLQEGCTMFEKCYLAIHELLNYKQSFKVIKSNINEFFETSLKKLFDSKEILESFTNALQDETEEELNVSEDLRITIGSLRDFCKREREGLQIDPLALKNQLLKDQEAQEEGTYSGFYFVSKHNEPLCSESDCFETARRLSNNPNKPLGDLLPSTLDCSLGLTSTNIGFNELKSQKCPLHTNSRSNERACALVKDIQLCKRKYIDCKKKHLNLQRQIADWKTQILSILKMKMKRLQYEYEKCQHCYTDSLVSSIPFDTIFDIVKETDLLNYQVDGYVNEQRFRPEINEDEFWKNVTKYKENLDKLKNYNTHEQRSKYSELIKETEMLKQYYEKSVVYIINVLHIKTKAVVEQNRQRAATDRIETRNRSIDALSRYVQETIKHLHYNRLIGQNLITDSVIYNNLKIVLDNSNTKLESLQDQLHNANATIINKNDKEIYEYLTQIQYDLQDITVTMQNKVINAVTVSKDYITNMEMEIFQNHLKFVENIVSIEENSIKESELLITGLVKGHSLVPFPLLLKTEEPLKNSKDKLINLHQYIKKANDNNQHSNKSNEDFAKVNASLMDYMKHKSEADLTIQLYFRDTINQFSKRYLVDQLRAINQNLLELECHISTKYSLIKELEIDVILDSDTQKSLVLPEALTTTAECKLLEAVNKWKVSLVEYNTKLTKLIDMNLDDILKQEKATCNTFLTQATKFKMALDVAFERSLKKQFTELKQTVSKQKTKINELQENINGAFAVLDSFYKELNTPGFLSKVAFVLWSYVSSKNEEPLAKRLQNIVLFTNRAICKLKTLENEILRTSGSIASLQSEKLVAQQNFSNKEAQYKELLDEKCKLIERLQQDHDNLMETSTKQNEIQRLSIIEKEETIVTQGAKLEELQEHLQTIQIECEKSCQIVEESKTKIKDLEDTIFAYEQELINSAKAIEVIKNASAKYSDAIHTENIRLLKSLEKITS